MADFGSRPTIAEQLSDVEYKDRPRRLGIATVRYTAPNGDVCIRYHDTDIVRIHEDGLITLDSGGWRTKTTKERINSYSPAGIRQEKGIWYIGDVVFYDSMMVDADGRPVTPPRPDLGLKMLISKARVDQFVKLVDGFDKLPMPDSGDCLLCRASGLRAPGSCVQQHVEENYLHGSLLVNAMRAAGWRDEQIGYHLRFAQGDRAHIKRALRKYVHQCLGTGIAAR
jgi:hypothetical protein